MAMCLLVWVTVLLHVLMIGVSTFDEELRGRNVVIWSDNSGAEHATRKGMLHFLLVLRHYVLQCYRHSKEL